MKNILTTLLVLFALVVNAQDTTGYKPKSLTGNLTKIPTVDNTRWVFKVDSFSLKPVYDTIEVKGLAIYLSNEDFEYGVDFKLVPTIKTVVKCRNCFKGFMYAKVNDFILALNQDVVKVEQLNIEKSHWWNGIFYEGWQELDLTKYKEFIFIEKPK